MSIKYFSCKRKNDNDREKSRFFSIKSLIKFQSHTEKINRIDEKKKIQSGNWTIKHKKKKCT